MGLAEIPIALVVSVVELCAIVAICVGTVLLWRRSAPAALEKRQRQVETSCLELGTQVEKIASQAGAWKVASETVLEEVETYFDKIERKRASTSASASRLSALQGNAGAPGADLSKLPRAEQIRAARAMHGG